MKLVLDEWIILEVIDTLYMARTTLLGMTGLDFPQDVAKKSANETAITRRISKAIDIIQQSEQPEAEFEKEYKSYMKSRKDDISGNAVTVNMKDLAHYFWNKGLNARKEDIVI